MAMNVGGGGEGEPMMEINTTPLIDVMLVLLIMLIITIPPQTHAVKLDLPQNNPTDAQERWNYTLNNMVEKKWLAAADRPTAGPAPAHRPARKGRPRGPVGRRTACRRMRS